MATYNSYSTHTGGSSVTTFTIGFNYLADTHVTVHVDGTLQTITTHYTINELKQVVFGSAPAGGTSILISRDTPDTNATRLVDFTAGSVLTESDLDTAHLQTLYKMQEMDEHRGTVTVASAEVLPMDSTWKVVSVTGDTQIDSITAGVDGQVITLMLNATITIIGTDANVLALQGLANYSATGGDTLVLFYDLGGTRWVEVSRSVN